MAGDSIMVKILKDDGKYVTCRPTVDQAIRVARQMTEMSRRNGSGSHYYIKVG